MIAKVFKSGNSLALRLPKELNPQEGEVSIEKIGERWIVEPLRPETWPTGFFEALRLDRPTFTRPEQGEDRPIEL